jgi:hypothetical protein
MVYGFCVRVEELGIRSEELGIMNYEPVIVIISSGRYADLPLHHANPHPSSLIPHPN